MHYIVLGGGFSPEKDVSLRSAHAVRVALEDHGHTVAMIDPSHYSIEELIHLSAKSGGVFPILHGEGGEDGALQRELSKAKIPYLGSEHQGCEDTYDKVAYKRILEAQNLPTPRSAILTDETMDTEPLLTRPFVAKPIGGGSSIDTFIVRTIPFDDSALREALTRHKKLLVEELITGHEITVGVLDNKALPVIEIIPPTDAEFDYENKYNGATQELCPPRNIPPEIQVKAQRLAEEIHQITGCRHLSRTDIMIDQEGNLYAIDTNTMPGMTDQSLFPKAALQAGYSWTQLVEQFTRLLA